jgi:hypothetical protein
LDRSGIDFQALSAETRELAKDSRKYSRQVRRPARKRFQQIQNSGVRTVARPATEQVRRKLADALLLVPAQRTSALQLPKQQWIVLRGDLRSMCSLPMRQNRRLASYSG